MLALALFSDEALEVKYVSQIHDFRQHTSVSFALTGTGFVATPPQSRVKVSMLLLPFVSSTTVMLVSELYTL